MSERFYRSLKTHLKLASNLMNQIYLQDTARHSGLLTHIPSFQGITVNKSAAKLWRSTSVLAFEWQSM
jgi:hypothetical protein